MVGGRESWGILRVSRHSNHSLKIHTTAETTGATVLGLLASMSHELGSSLSTPDVGGPWDVAHVITRQEPSLPFETLSIGTFLGLIGLAGKCVDSDGTHPGVVAYAQKHQQCGTAGRASTNHLSVTYSDGHIVPRSITGSVGEFARASAVMRGTTPDGDTAPYTVAYNAALPTSVTREFYGIGKPTILGQEVTRVRSVTVDCNPQIEFSQDADTIWPSIVDVQRIRTLTTIVTEDPEWLDAASYIDPVGAIAAHADSEIWWLQYEPTGTPVSGGRFKDFTATSHIQGTLSGLVHVSQAYSASGAGVSATQIQVAGLDESGTAPIVWDTSAAYV